jgi:hypothetical protein
MSWSITGMLKGDLLQPLTESAEEVVRLKVDVIVTTATEPSLSGPAGNHDGSHNYGWGE